MGIARVSNLFYGNGCHTWVQELHRFFNFTTTTTFGLHVEPAMKAGNGYILHEKFEILTSGRLYVVEQAVDLFTLYRALHLSRSTRCTIVPIYHSLDMYRCATLCINRART